MMIRTTVVLLLALVSQIHVGVGESTQIRPAEAACNEYRKKFYNGGSETVDFDNFNDGPLKPEEFPFLVSLRYKIGDEFHHACTGSLITNQYVLTTAHCMNNINNFKPDQALLGGVTLNDTSSNVQIRSVSKVISHPKYKRSARYYNIGIVQLSTPVNITKFVRPICLQYESLTDLSTSSRNSVIAAGWSVDIINEETFSLLKTHSLSIGQRSACVDDYKNVLKLSHGLDDSMMCVIKEATYYFCASRGVQLLQEYNQSTILIGISAIGQSCIGRIPDVYSSVYYHLDWIEGVIWSDKKTQFEN